MIGLTRISHINFFYKENNMYLPFGKSYNKLLDIKCHFEFTTYIKNELS